MTTISRHEATNSGRNQFELERGELINAQSVHPYTFLVKVSNRRLEVNGYRRSVRQ